MKIGGRDMGHFYFTRHGQTVWNIENKICGASDSPLTEFGIKNCEIRRYDW